MLPPLLSEDASKRFLSKLTLLCFNCTLTEKQSNRFNISQPASVKGSYCLVEQTRTLRSGQPSQFNGFSGFTSFADVRVAFCPLGSIDRLLFDLDGKYNEGLNAVVGPEVVEVVALGEGEG